ncbi:hypothetical protein E3N88_28011 [Mikania micrantha]|uniref:mitogen-activated protein kinase kinase kinase n=1 Tax=Mikania micrantha TaxID=192012 RepID=A0A5N6MZF4_9ASTR|nr:hypothetical protein E3N88_28011 [Mikania micrantha]
MFTKQKRLVRKLDRKNAFKNIDYDASLSSSSSSSSSLFDLKSAHRAQSLDISLFSDQISHRIEGIDGEVESICRSLGLSGPEDFAIPVADWEAHKACSVTCTSYTASPRFLCSNTGSIKDSPESDLSVNSESPTTVNDAVRVIRVLNEGGDDGCKGKSRIKGFRPPLLARPPVMLPVIADNPCSDWGLIRGFSPAISSSTEDAVGPALVEDEEPNVTMKSRTIVAQSTDLECFVSPNGSIRCSIKNWQKGDFLGSGSFGTVYEGFNEYGFFFAVKEVSLLDQGIQGKQCILQIEQEIFLLSQFQHDNIVRYLGTDKDDGKVYIFLELVPKGSLADLYQKYHLRDSQVSTYTRQILSGLTYLHDRNVVHRDIKCANILVDVTGSVKLADFGLAKTTKLNDIKSCKGTPFWMAPEVVNNRKNTGYGPAADIWSLGCTVLEMLTSQVPYSHLEGMQALFRIGSGELPSIPKTLSVDARDFILACLQVNPNDRPTAAQLLNHPFVHTPASMTSSPVSPLCNAMRS